MHLTLSLFTGIIPGKWFPHRLSRGTNNSTTYWVFFELLILKWERHLLAVFIITEASESEGAGRRRELMNWVPSFKCTHLLLPLFKSSFVSMQWPQWCCWHWQWHMLLLLPVLDSTARNVHNSHLSLVLSGSLQVLSSAIHLGAKGAQPSCLPESFLAATTAPGATAQPCSPAPLTSLSSC